MPVTKNAGMWPGSYETGHKNFVSSFIPSLKKDANKVNFTKIYITNHWYLKEKCTLRLKIYIA